MLHKANPWNFKKIEFDHGIDGNVYLFNALRSSFWPGWGQKKSSLVKKSKFFTYSVLGLSSLGVGSYFVSDYYQKEYESKETISELLDSKYQYGNFNSITNGLIVTGSLLYLMNIFDAYFSKATIPDDMKYKHFQNFKRIRTNLPVTRQIYNKENKGNGELKIFCSIPNVEIYLLNDTDTTLKENFYGKTSCSFDENTYFTISDVEPGSYKLICKKDYFQEVEKTIKIEEYKVSYEIVKMKEKPFSGSAKFFINSVPGLAQFNRNDRIKGFTISGIAAASLMGSLILNTQAGSDLNKYNDSESIERIVNYRSDYNKHIMQRNTFFVIFGFNMIYNLYDAYLGEK